MPQKIATKSSKKQERQVDTSVPMTTILPTLEDTYPHHPMGDLTEGQPYLVLVACILSLRTKDDVSIPASKRLFELADTPEAMVKLDADTVASTVYPTGFYKTKAVTIIEASQTLLDRYQGQVPDTIDELMKLKGVGRKTANLVVGLGHRLPAICVDTHVHRICNRLGYLTTQTPDETEFALREHLPMPYWQAINRVMVRHGQECCKPIGPRCDVCPVANDCRQIDTKPRKPPAPSTFVQAKKRALKRNPH